MEPAKKIHDLAVQLDLPEPLIKLMAEQGYLEEYETQTAIFDAFCAHGEGVFNLLIWRGDDTGVKQFPFIDDYVGNIATSINQRAKVHGYSTQYFPCNRHIADGAYYVGLLAKRPNAGLISLMASSPQVIAEVCAELGRPVVFIDYQGTEDVSDYYTVSIANFTGMRKLVRCLIDLGHERIGFIAGTLILESAQQRLEGYQAALAEANIAYDETLVIEGDWTPDSGQACAQQLLNLAPRPTALVASNDMMATGAITAALAAGLRVPQDVSITGVDDLQMAETCKPSLTTLRQPMFEMGELAVDLVIDLLEGRRPIQQHFEYPAQLIERGSTGPAPA